MWVKESQGMIFNTTEKYFSLETVTMLKVWQHDITGMKWKHEKQFRSLEALASNITLQNQKSNLDP